MSIPMRVPTYRSFEFRQIWKGDPRSPRPSIDTHLDIPAERAHILPEGYITSSISTSRQEGDYLDLNLWDQEEPLP